MSKPILQVDVISAGYAGENVIYDINFEIHEGEAVAIIGSNGAGKSTLFRSIASMLKITSGRVIFDGTDTTNRPTHKLARDGLAYVPAERHLFPEMSVHDNLLLGAFPNRPDPATEKTIFDVFPRLEERKGQHAGTMSGGEQQMLAVGRALMSRPKVLMLDEPTTGLAPRLARESYDALAVLRDQGLTLVVAEQQVPLVLELAERGYVIENGRFELSGTSAELAGNPDVQRAYLGIA